MKIAQFQGDARFNLQAWIAVDAKRRLRLASAVLDLSCPHLVRQAIADLVQKYIKPDAVRLVSPRAVPAEHTNQQAKISRTMQRQLTDLAYRHRCSRADLVREAIDDWLVANTSKIDRKDRNAC